MRQSKLAYLNNMFVCWQVWKHLVLDTKLRVRANGISNAITANSNGTSSSPSGAASAPSSGQGHIRTSSAARVLNKSDEAMRARVEYRALKPGLMQLCSVEEPQEMVLGNILVDAKPHIGRARLQLQYLWPDIAGRCTTVQVDYMPCAPPLPRLPPFPGVCCTAWLSYDI